MCQRSAGRKVVAEDVRMPSYQTEGSGRESAKIWPQMCIARLPVSDLNEEDFKWLVKWLFTFMA